MDLTIIENSSSLAFHGVAGTQAWLSTDPSLDDVADLARLLRRVADEVNQAIAQLDAHVLDRLGRVDHPSLFVDAQFDEPF